MEKTKCVLGIKKKRGKKKKEEKLVKLFMPNKVIKTFHALRYQKVYNNNKESVCETCLEMH